MPTVTMTDRLVATIRATRRETLFDTKARGLALRVSAKGAKAWYFTYRRNGPTQWVRLGGYPGVALADARRSALEHRHAIDLEGRDPAAERRAPEPQPAPVFTFADLVAGGAHSNRSQFPPLAENLPDCMRRALQRSPRCPPE
jgi:hypothetical protein